MPSWRQCLQVVMSWKHARKRLTDDPLPIRIQEAVSRHEEAGLEVRTVIKEMLERNDELSRENAAFRRRFPDAR